MQAVMGTLSSTASALCLAGISICFMAAPKSSPPLLPVHPRAAAAGVGLHLLSPQGATSEPNAMCEGGGAVATLYPLPFPMCVTISIQAPGKGYPMCSTW